MYFIRLVCVYWLTTLFLPFFVPLTGRSLGAYKLYFQNFLTTNFWIYSIIERISPEIGGQKEKRDYFILCLAIPQAVTAAMAVTVD